MVKLILKSHRLLKESFSARDGLAPYKLLVCDAPELSPQHIGSATALGCSSELDVKTVPPKTPHVLVIRHKGIKLKLVWKLPPCWKDLTMLEGIL